LKYYKDYSSYIKGKAKKSIKCQPMMLQESGRIKSEGKVQKAMREYDDWHWKFTEI